MVLLPVMADLLVTAYDWRGAMLVIGGFIANTIPFAIAMRTPERTQCNATNEEMALLLQENPDDSSPSSSSLPSLSTTIASSTDHHVTTRTHSSHDEHSLIEKIMLAFKESDFYRDPVLNFVFVSTMLNMVVYSTWHAFLVPFGTSRGLSIHQVVIMTGFAAAGNISGRLISGVITHRLCTPIMCSLVLNLVEILSLLITLIVHNLYVALSIPFISTFCIGSRVGIYSMIVRARASRDRFSTAEAIQVMCMGVGSLVGTPTSGLVADKFSSYDATFVFLIAVDGIVVLTLAPLLVIKRPERLEDD